jgi:hypothetical protein
MTCSLVEVHRRLGGKQFLHLQDLYRFSLDLTRRLLGLLYHPENVGSTFFRNVDELLPNKNGVMF